MKSIMEQTKNKIQDYFKELQFKSEEHTYEVNGKSLTSVSKTINRYVEKVDFNMIAGFVAKKRGITKEEVLAEWNAKRDISCSQGTAVHLFGENYTKGKVPTNGFEEAIVKFWDNIPDYIEPFLFELKMFSRTLGVAGTSDIILYNNKTGKFIIADYKTNEDLFKNFKGKTLLEPFNNLLDSPYNKYQLQLSLYQLLFEQCGFEVESRRIIWLKPDGTYENFKTEDLTKELLKELTKN